MMAVWLLPLARGDDWIGIIVFLVFVFLSLIAQGMKKIKGVDESESPTPSPGQRPAPQRPVAPPVTTPDDEIRKFLEALGKPKTASAPPPVLRPVPQPQPMRRPKPLPRKPTPVPTVLAPEEEDEEEGPKQVPAKEVPKEGIASFEAIQQLDVGKEMRAVEAQVEKDAKGAFIEIHATGLSRAGQFAKLLQNNTNVRRAIVMAEIVAPPLALR